MTEYNNYSSIFIAEWLSLLFSCCLSVKKGRDRVVSCRFHWDGAPCSALHDHVVMCYVTFAMR